MIHLLVPKIQSSINLFKYLHISYWLESSSVETFPDIPGESPLEKQLFNSP